MSHQALGETYFHIMLQRKTKKSLPVENKKGVSKSTGVKGKLLTDYLKKTPHFFWRNQKMEVVAIGTAHVSEQSLKDVETVFSLYRPDAVAVELCPQRLQVLMEPERWKHLDIEKVIKQKKIWLLCSSLILSTFQKKLVHGSKALPGMEMKAAVKLAKKNKLHLITADREIRTTLSRTWSKIGFFSRLNLTSFLLASLFVAKPMEQEEIEELKSKDILDDLLSELPKRYIPLRKTILDERDICLAAKIHQGMDGISPKRRRPLRVLAVLGAAHLKGVEKNLKRKQPVDITELLSIPKQAWYKNTLSWFVFAVVIWGITTFLVQDGLELSSLGDLVLAWTLSRSLGAGVGALLSYPTITTFILTVLCAPISYFLGFIGVRLWMVSALSEIRSRKPRVEDFENIIHDTKSFYTFGRGLYRNRMIHLLFLIFSVSLGLTIGNLFFFRFIFFQ